MGGVLAFLYFAFFQTAGIVLARSFLKRERAFTCVVLGSAAGSVLLMWLPALWAFLFGFTVAAHIAAFFTALVLVLAAAYFRRPEPILFSPRRVVLFLSRDPGVVLPAALLLLFAFLCVHSYRWQYGEIWSSQCTYGDMSMHLGFITSIAEQGEFPPTYSILPQVKLSYPFLSDSISSSLYLLGATLRFAYILPMLFAAGQVFFGGWLLFRAWLKDAAKAALASVLFFLNGGFGFAYFLGDLQNDLGNFTRIFTAFYETPTNLTTENIRWVNVIVDIMLPQRASLFGWASLFPVLYLLYWAVYEQKRRYFLPAGIFAGAMVMIHTHSFLALGLISGGWLLFAAGKAAFPDRQPGFMRTVKLGVAILLLTPFCAQFLIPNLFSRDSLFFLILVIAAAVAFVLLLVVLLGITLLGGGIKRFAGWGVYLCAALLTAVPQLLFWTFTQVNDESFVRGWYNWGNLRDGYLWFYLVNLGVFAVFVLPALFSARGRLFKIAAPAAIIWFICEFAVFQPNTYDNNKLLYVAYFLFCAPAAGYMVDLFRRLKGLPMRSVLAGVCLFLCTVSAALTILRESVAGYCLYGHSQLNAASFITGNTEPTDTILTDMRHNNEVAALTGRNIVCGSTSYVYFHGLDYRDREADLAQMFMDPEGSFELFEKYSVDYIMVSDFERANFGADAAQIGEVFPCVYEDGSIMLFRVEAPNG